MRNMLAFLAAAVIALAAVGFYLDWFNIYRTPAPDGHQSITLDVNTVKIGEDLRKAEQKLQKQLAEKASREKEKEKPAPVTPPPADVGHVNVITDR